MATIFVPVGRLGTMPSLDSVRLSKANDATVPAVSLRQAKLRLFGAASFTDLFM